MEWITFVGEGRSGHTIVSAILDSHPHVRVSEEQKYITKWRRDGWSKDKIIKHLLDSGYGKERKPKALPGMLTYKEPLMAIGDKCGWDAVNEVRKRNAPDNILDLFSDHMGMPVKVIHTSRNPHDNISAWLDSPKYIRLYPEEYYRARMMIRRYSRFYTALEKIIVGQGVFHLRNEELCSNPGSVLVGLCEFLDLPQDEEWLVNASQAVFKKPNERSKSREWIPEIHDMINWRIKDKYPSLECYRDKL